MVRDNLYSRTVYVAKLVLPLVAIGLLSTVFLLARSPNPDEAVSFAKVDVETLTKEQRLSSPRFAGESEDGASFSLIADHAKPHRWNPTRLQADAISLAVNGLRGDGTLHVQAKEGEVDTRRRSLALNGDVALRSSLGIVLRTNALEATFDTLGVTSPGEVRGSTPFGTLVAGRMQFSTDASRDQQLLLFDQGVQLVYDPTNP